MRYVRETRVGLSFARNRGIQEARGDIIAFVDDDICFDRGWLAAITQAFDDNPQINAVGGKSIPNFESDKPDWITEDFYQIYGSTRSGDEDRLLVFPEHPFGLNMAFRKVVFKQIGQFNTDLGRTGTSLLSNEEKDIFYRMSVAGLKVYYSPKAILYHRIPADRMDKSWILNRIYWQAVSDVIFDQSIQKHSKFMLLNVAVSSLKTLVTYTCKTTLKNLCLYRRAFSFTDKTRLYRLLGNLRQNFMEIFATPR